MGPPARCSRSVDRAIAADLNIMKTGTYDKIRWRRATGPGSVGQHFQSRVGVNLQIDATAVKERSAQVGAGGRWNFHRASARIAGGHDGVGNGNGTHGDAVADGAVVGYIINAGRNGR